LKHHFELRLRSVTRAHYEPWLTCGCIIHSSVLGGSKWSASRYGIVVTKEGASVYLWIGFPYTQT